MALHNELARFKDGKWAESVCVFRIGCADLEPVFLLAALHPFKMFTLLIGELWRAVC